MNVSARLLILCHKHDGIFAGSELLDPYSSMTSPSQLCLSGLSASAGSGSAKPLLPFRRPDAILQSIVYKTVPGLHRDEMQRRQLFYADKPNAGQRTALSAHCVLLVLPVMLLRII